MTRHEYNNAVDQHADSLYRFLLKSMGEAEAAKDVVQDVFTKLWEKHEAVSFEKAKSYLFTAGYRTMIDVFRRQKFIGNYDEVVEQNLSHSPHYTGLAEILEDALKRLPEIQRSAILLRDYEGYNYQEIGSILTLTESQVKVYIFRARKSLQQHLKSVESLI